MKSRLQKLKHYNENRVADVEQTNPRKWWKHIKSLTGQGIQNEWYIINSSKAQRMLSQPLTPPVSSTQIPVELLVTEEEVSQSLLSIDTTKAVGPDDIPNKLLKNFSFELAPVIKDIYNQSLKEAYVPTLLKSSIVVPIPKIVPPKDVESDLRPISLTCTIAKVMEGFTCTRLLSQLNGKMDPRQYARRGHSTTDALLYMLQAIYEALILVTLQLIYFSLTSVKVLT